MHYARTKLFPASTLTIGYSRFEAKPRDEGDVEIWCFVTSGQSWYNETIDIQAERIVSNLSKDPFPNPNITHMEKLSTDPCLFEASVFYLCNVLLQF